jgi:hypothetical protein
VGDTALSHSGFFEAKSGNRVLGNQRLAILNLPVFGHVRQSDGLCEVHMHTMEGFWATVAQLAAPAPGHFPREASL